MGSKRITPEEVREFHLLYDKYGTFAEVARRTGRSAKSVSKYVNNKSSYKPLVEAAHQEFTR